MVFESFSRIYQGLLKPIKNFKCNDIKVVLYELGIQLMHLIQYSAFEIDYFWTSCAQFHQKS